MVYLKTLLLLAVFPVAVSCIAQTNEKKDPIDADYESCVGKDSSKTNVSNCAYTTYGKWHSELDKAYGRVMKKLRRPADKAALKQAQTAWLAYQSAEFAAYDNMFNIPGTKWYAVRLNNRINVIKERVQQLRSYYAVLDEE